MPTHLKAYTPSEKGKELISILFTQTHAERQNSMVEYWQHYPQEINAILDGFHFIILELIDGRNTKESDEQFSLPDELFQVIFNAMREKLHFFSYLTAREFLAALDGIEPPIFKSPEKIAAFLDPSSEPRKKEYVSQYNLPGQFDESVLEKLKEICGNTEVWFNNALKTLPSIRNSQKLIAKFQNVNNEITLMDVKLATETLNESKKNFNDNASLIAQNWLYIHDVHRKYTNHVLSSRIYARYLAKLLVTRESRYPIENYVLNLARQSFDFEMPNFDPTDLQLQQGITSVTLQKKYMDQLNVEISRLECRYRKRRLMVKLKENVPKSAVIRELLEIAHIDPVDIKTHILLARMFAEYALSTKSAKQRPSFKEQALKFCNLAFSKIDDYLDLQAIEQINARDIQRAGFVKSISAIRIPLLRKK